MTMSTQTKTPTDHLGTYRKYRIKEENITKLRKFVEKIENNELRKDI